MQCLAKDDLFYYQIRTVRGKYGSRAGNMTWGYSLFQTSSVASGHLGDRWTNKPAMRDDRVSPLSDHYTSC